MATALNEVTGWPIYGIVDASPKGNIVTLCHAFVRSHEGRFYDALGQIDPIEIMNAYADFLRFAEFEDDHEIQVYELGSVENMMRILKHQWGASIFGQSKFERYHRSVVQAKEDLFGLLADRNRDWLPQSVSLSP